MPALSAEQRLLLGCLRVPLSPAESGELRELCGRELDWEAVLSLSARHRVGSLVFWSLQAVGWGAAPEWARERLSRAFHIHASHTFALARELLRVSGLLEAAGVPMVSLKGPTLALSAYGSVALRQFSDLDILVPRAQVLHARRILIENGFRSRLELARAQEAAHLRDDSVFDLVRDDGLDGRPTDLELHWALTARAFARPIAFEHVNLRLHRKPLVGGAACQLDPADLLIMLCVHGTKHLWERLQWITDISQLLRQAELASNGSAGSGEALDWERVRGLAVRFRAERMVALGLVLAHDVLQAPVPPQVLAWARALPPVEALAEQVRSRLFAEPGEAGPNGEANLAGTWFLMRAMDSWSDRARFALHIATTPPAEERAALVLPGPLERLRPLVRSSRLIASHLSHARASRKSRAAAP